MNAAIAGVCERAERIGGEACGIQGGFAGLAERRAVPMTGDEARAHAEEAGTWLGTSRWKALETAAGRDACVQALEALGLDGLVVIGGHGSALGAQMLADALPVALHPGDDRPRRRRHRRDDRHGLGDRRSRSRPSSSCA